VLRYAWSLLLEFTDLCWLSEKRLHVMLLVPAISRLPPCIPCARRTAVLVWTTMSLLRSLPIETCGHGTRSASFRTLIDVSNLVRVASPLRFIVSASILILHWQMLCPMLFASFHHPLTHPLSLAWPSPAIVQT